MKTRFDLEQDIMVAWSLVDDLNILNEAICDGDMTPDEVANALLGLSTIGTLKFEKLFNTFTALIDGIGLADEDDSHGCSGKCSGGCSDKKSMFNQPLD